MSFCRERLHYLHVVLIRQNGCETVRQLARRFHISRDEVDEAVKLGWVSLEVRKPTVGRPSVVAILNWELGETDSAKLPPWKSQFGKEISIRHEMFALYSVTSTVKHGNRQFGIPGIVDAYLRVFPRVKSRRAACSGCSRLLRHPNVRAARQWFYATTLGEVRHEPMPETAYKIWKRLRELGNWRARWAE